MENPQIKKVEIKTGPGPVFFMPFAQDAYANASCPPSGVNTAPSVQETLRAASLCMVNSADQARADVM